MTYFDLVFWLFVVLTLILYYLVPKPAQKYILLLGSLCFYCFCGIQNLLFIITVALVTWTGAYLISRFDQKQNTLLQSDDLTKNDKRIIKSSIQKEKRAVFWTSLAIPIFILCITKYLRPIINTIETNDSELVQSIIIPLGISFYTFQALGYLIDVYNGKYVAEKSFPLYLLFISYFPQIIQGPISRFDKLGNQFSSGKKFEAHNIKQGLIIILWGAFKKLAVADRIAPFINNATGESFGASGSVALVTVLLYAIQLYADFSGGIDIALGISKMFGIELPANFKRPYFSISMADFWRRWHITLGSWMRDYVFYPLAICKPMRTITGAIKKRSKTFAKVFPAIIGNIVVFLIIGVWHGAKATFIVWGLYNGVLLAMSAAFENKSRLFRQNHKELVARNSWHVLCVVRTFLLVLIGYFFDCAYSLKDSLKMISSLFLNFQFGDLINGTVFEMGLSKGGMIKLIPAILVIFVVSLLSENGKDIISWINNRKLLFRSFIFSVLLVAFLFFTANGFNDVGGFMYAIF